ncbi:MAG TPA: CHAT domain-containing protein, partial [Albitalea sp.]|nr:CHAT domain-containing protein [Albitalea sp.]
AGLARHGFDVDRAIGRAQRAIDVINGLYKHPYRIVHIAGHGMFDEGLDEASRSGVVLSDGLLITAAEIDAMEIVPDLVFLNCCHLGKLERSPVAFNKLAYSVARQLIDIGVRAVVVAGWAVEDAPASLFAETFYDRLLSDNLPFGEAVFQARRTTWERYPASITWGAYQAYGDPGWRADPRTEQAAPETQTATSGVTPEELLDKLEGERIELQRAGATLSATEAARLIAKVRQWFDATPTEWVQRPDLMSALGELYADLGEQYLDLACECFRRAIKASDKIGRVPIKSIEHLASCEARLGESHNDARVVGGAITRLTQLLHLTDDPTDAEGIPTADANPERAGLLGSAWKRKAAVHARAYLKDSSPDELALMTDALQHSVASYHAMASQLGAKEVRPYQTLNWLFLWSIRADSSERLAYVPHVQRCAAAANAEFSEDPMAFNSTMVADATLVVALLDGSLAAQGSAGDPALARIAAAYEDALQGALVTPRERDLVLQQIQFMALFHQAYEKATGTASDASLGTRLEALSQRLSPDNY